jgi:hypothetical protein
MEAVREEKPAGTVVMVLDNATIYRSEASMRAAEELGIIPVFLPPYSPGLNPIEIGWRDMRRELAAVLNFDLLVEDSGPTALELFKKRKMSYSAHWGQVFLYDKR